MAVIIFTIGQELGEELIREGIDIFLAGNTCVLFLAAH